ncbi:MAG: transcription antitermination factor NusB [Pseudomonadota bacterium]
MTADAADTGPSIAPKGSRAAARLAAVQALFQLSRSEDKADAVITQFRDFRFGTEFDGIPFPQADEAFFSDIVKAVAARPERYDEVIAARLASNWRIERIDPLVLQILRAGAYELMDRLDVPKAVVITQYVDVAHAFYDDQEPKFVNGLLDRLATELRR